MKAAYIQSIGGASGDMLLGAFLDLGIPLEAVESQIVLLGITGYGLSSEIGTR